VYALAVPDMKYSACSYPTCARSKLVDAMEGFPRPPVIGPVTVGLGTAAPAPIASVTSGAA